MKGLLRNNYYGVIDGAKILLSLFAVMGIALLISGSSELFIIFALAPATLLAFNAVSSLRKDASTKWIKYELTTPVRRKDIIKSRYISHALWTLIGSFLPFIFVAFAILIHGNKFFYPEMRDPVACFSAGLSSALFIGVFFYPSVYCLGTEKNELLLILSLIGAIATTMGIAILLYAGSDANLTDVEFFIAIVISLAIATAAYILSYFITTFIYPQKEY